MTIREHTAAPLLAACEGPEGALVHQELRVTAHPGVPAFATAQRIEATGS